MKKSKRVLACLVAGVMALGVASGVSVDTTFAKAKSKVRVVAAKKALCKGQKTTVTVKGTKKKVSKWTSSKKKVITVKKIGKRKARITAKKVGTAYIRAKVGRKTYKVKVRVENPRLSRTSYTLSQGKNFTLSISGTKSTPRVVSSNTRIAKVTKVSKYRYRISGVSSGKTKVTATINGKSFGCTVTVKGTSSKPSNPTKPVNPSDYPWFSDIPESTLRGIMGKSASKNFMSASDCVANGGHIYIPISVKSEDSSHVYTVESSALYYPNGSTPKLASPDVSVLYSMQSRSLDYFFDDGVSQKIKDCLYTINNFMSNPSLVSKYNVVTDGAGEYTTTMQCLVCGHQENKVYKNGDCSHPYEVSASGVEVDTTGYPYVCDKCGLRVKESNNFK